MSTTREQALAIIAKLGFRELVTDEQRIDALIAAGVIRETDNTGDDELSDDAVTALQALQKIRLLANRGYGLNEEFNRIWHLADDAIHAVARSSGVADTTKKLDPEPWWNTYNGERSTTDKGPWWRFKPQDEFEQDESKYPHMQGVADTVKEGNNDE